MSDETDDTGEASPFPYFGAAAAPGTIGVVPNVGINAGVAPPTTAVAQPNPLMPGAGTNTNYGSISATHEAWIRQKAAQLGVDPEHAVAIAKAEGLGAWSAKNPNAASLVDIDPKTGKPFSFGDFQMNIRNGLGTEAQKAGLDPTDPNQWQKVDEFALKHMATGDFSPWKSDKGQQAWEASHGGAGKSVAAGATNNVATKPVEATSTNAPPGPNLNGLYTYAMLSSMFPQHKFTPITYDPFAVMPK